MSRTFKKFAYGCFRSPKGYRQAKIAGVRKRKVPPSSYDDVPYDKQCWLPNKVADKLAKKAWTYQEIVRHLMKKYKVRLGDAEWMAKYAVLNERRSQPEGLMKVYDEIAL